MIKLTDKLVAKYIMHEEPREYTSDIVEAFRIVERFQTGCNNHTSAAIELHITDQVTYPDCECIICAPDIEDCFGWGSDIKIAICRAAMVFARKYCNEH